MMPTERTEAGDFEIRRKLGEGATGAVFEAICRREWPEAGVRAGQVVALKRLRKRVHLEREIRALTTLAHPNIVRCFGVVEWRSEGWDEGVGLICERLEGEDLASRLKRERRGLPWREALAILDQALEGLIHAESKGVAHRDLKPSNLFLCSDGTVKWIDFGLARRAGGAAGLSVSAAEGWAGTFDYMAPEFARLDGFAGDGVSDIFSFGVLAFEVLTGLKAFEPLGDHPEIGFFRRWAGERLPEPRCPAGVLEAIEGLGAFLRTCLAPDRSQRFATFSQVRSALAGLRPRVWKGETEEWQANGFLGEGGFSRVYRVLGLRSGREAALKQLHSRRHEWRFQREADLMRRLQQLRHAALPRLFEWWVEPEPDGSPCLAMEYLPGETLKERLIAEPEGLAMEETVALFQRYLEGLAALHDAGLAHRDVKPSNLYAPAGHPEEARLLDLGVACEKDGTLSMAGLPPGTLDYMAPELVTQPLQRGSPQSDLFALGYVLYETLTGRPAMVRLPPEEPAALKALIHRSGDEAAFCAAFTGFDHPVFEAHPQLALVIGRAMRFDPQRRYGGGPEAPWNGDGARAMREELMALRKRESKGRADEPGNESLGEPLPTRDLLEQPDPVPGERRPRRLRPPPWTGWAFLLVAILTLSLWGVLRQPSAPDVSPLRVPAVSESAPSDEAPEAPPDETAREEEPSDESPEQIATEPSLPVETPPSPEEERVVIRPKPPDPNASEREPRVEERIETVPSPPVPPAIPDEEGRWRQEIAEGERTVEPWVGWLFRPSDPLRSLLPARFDPAAERPDPVRVPALTGDERLRLSREDRIRYDRLVVWQGAVKRGLAVGEAEAWRALAREAEGISVLHQRLEKEAAMVAWDGRWLPEVPRWGDPEYRLWQAYALGALGSEDEGRQALSVLAELARQSKRLLPVDAALAIRLADDRWRRYVRNLMERRPDEVVRVGTGRARQDPVAAYRMAVLKLRPAVLEEAGWLREVANSLTADEAVGWFEARVEGAVAGDWVMGGEVLNGTPLERVAEMWRAKRGDRRSPSERVVWHHISGTAPLPERMAELPGRER